MLKEDWFLKDRLKLRHLRVLTALHTYRHVGKAAQQLHTTQPALSKALAELERMLEVKLFERSPAGLLPTPPCKVAVERAREVFGSLERLGDDLKSLELGIEGTINVGASNSATALLLPHTILRLKETLPAVSVEVADGPFSRQIQDLLAHKLDFVIGRLEPEQDTTGLEEIILFNVHMILLCAIDHPLLNKVELSLADLADWPWIMPSHESVTHQGLELMFHQMGRRPREYGVSCNTLMTNAPLIQSTRALGIAAIPTAAPFINAGLLAAVPLSLPPVFGHISLFQASTHQHQLKDEIFLQCARAASQAMSRAYLS